MLTSHISSATPTSAGDTQWVPCASSSATWLAKGWWATATSLVGGEGAIGFEAVIARFTWDVGQYGCEASLRFVQSFGVFNGFSLACNFSTQLLLGRQHQ